MKFYQLSFDHRGVIEGESVYFYKFVPVSGIQVKGEPFTSIPEYPPKTIQYLVDPEGNTHPFMVVEENKFRMLLAKEIHEITNNEQHCHILHPE